MSIALSNRSMPYRYLMLTKHPFLSYSLSYSESKPFSLETTANPAIRNTENVLRHKILHPGEPLPPLPNLVAQPFQRLPALEAKSEEARLELIRVAEIKSSRFSGFILMQSWFSALFQHPNPY